MANERVLRGTLYFTFFYNLMGFVTFLLPEKFGTLAGLPAPAPFVYSGFVAFNILIFAFVGLWQARKPWPDAPVLIVFGTCKIAFCAVMAIALAMGEVTGAGFLMSVVDLAMGVIFLMGAASLEGR